MGGGAGAGMSGGGGGKKQPSALRTVWPSTVEWVSPVVAATVMVSNAVPGLQGTGLAFQACVAVSSGVD